MVQVEIRSIEAIGKVIDAALGAGATNIGALRLFASSTDTARREAITNAVTKARAEAEAAAVAAGGSLGPMIEFTIDPFGLPRPFETVVLTSAVSGAAPAPTPIETGELVIQAVVRAKWQFVARQRQSSIAHGPVVIPSEARDRDHPEREHCHSERSEESQFAR
jgi:uncharacterized protein